MSAQTTTHRRPHIAIRLIDYTSGPDRLKSLNGRGRVLAK